MTETFGQFLARHREKAGLSQHAFAKKASTTQQFVSNLENDQRSMPFERLNDWAIILGLSPTEFRRFRLLAAITHLPKDARPDIAQLIERVEHLEARLRKIG